MSITFEKMVKLPSVSEKLCIYLFHSVRVCLLFIFARSFGGCESDSVVGEVEFGVIRSDEDVSEDPKRAGRRRNIDAHEAGQAESLAGLTHA